MTTLTRLQLNPRHREARRDISDVHRLHQRVMSLLPDALGDSARAKTAALWRIEPSDQPVLLIQSDPVPDLSALPAGYGTGATKDLSAVFTAIRPGLHVRYRICINPVSQHGNTGKRRVLPRSELPAWWEARSQRIGLENLDHPSIHLEPSRTGTTSTGNKLTIAACRIEGIASVTDPDQICEAIRSGVGRARAYGCGLLTIAPL